MKNLIVGGAALATMFFLSVAWAGNKPIRFESGVAVYKSYAKGSTGCVYSSASRVCCKSDLEEAEIQSSLFGKSCASKKKSVTASIVADCSFKIGGQLVHGKKWECGKTKIADTPTGGTVVTERISATTDTGTATGTVKSGGVIGAETGENDGKEEYTPISTTRPALQSDSEVFKLPLYYSERQKIYGTQGVSNVSGAPAQAKAWAKDWGSRGDANTPTPLSYFCAKALGVGVNPNVEKYPGNFLFGNRVNGVFSMGNKIEPRAIDGMRFKNMQQEVTAIAFATYLTLFLSQVGLSESEMRDQNLLVSQQLKTMLSNPKNANDSNWALYGNDAIRKVADYLKKKGDTQTATKLENSISSTFKQPDPLSQGKARSNYTLTEALEAQAMAKARDEFYLYIYYNNAHGNEQMNAIEACVTAAKKLR